MRSWNICSSRSETKHFKLHLIICELEGLPINEIPNKDNYAMQVQIKSRVPGKSYLSRRSVQRDHTSKQYISPNGIVHWNEGFEQNCKFRMEYKNSRSWKINLEVHGSGMESKSEASILAKLRMDITEFADLTESSEKIVKLPVKCCIGGSTLVARLMVKLDVFEVQNLHMNNTVHPISPTQLLASLSACASFQTQTRNKMDSSSSESDKNNDPSYRCIKTTNLLSGQFIDNRVEYGKGGHWEEEKREKASLKRLLSWNIRKPSFKGLDHPRDEPLLNKEYGEEGGDDIDSARRSLLSHLQPREDEVKNDFVPVEFLGSDRFEIGKWERRKVMSRDGKLELETEIFLASIDQRSEKASGGGACTVLATVIADWLHQNPENLPLQCQFDKLIRDGSLEWRNLCKDEIHSGKFLDQHFDLETVIQAQIRPLMVVPEKSYIGFFELENMSNKLELLQDAMSFDNIWDELQHSGSTLEPKLYIVSWNDHFFVLKFEKDAIYTIDTLGERLSEGCNRAYILKFNRESMIYRVQPENGMEENENRDSQEFICKGKSCCKEFIKGFLAALPLGELQSNIEKGIIGKAPLHQLLQIEFQYMTPCNKNSPSLEKNSSYPCDVGIEECIDPSGSIEQ